MYYEFSCIGQEVYGIPLSHNSIKITGFSETTQILKFMDPERLMIEDATILAPFFIFTRMPSEPAWKRSIVQTGSKKIDCSPTRLW